MRGGLEGRHVPPAGVQEAAPPCKSPLKSIQQGYRGQRPPANNHPPQRGYRGQRPPANRKAEARFGPPNHNTRSHP
jgi:hypothetical protein